MRRFFQFSLRTWFVFLTVATIAFVVWQNVQKRKQLELAIIQDATLVYKDTRRTEKPPSARGFGFFSFGMRSSPNPDVVLRDSEIFPWASQLSKGSVAFCAFDSFHNDHTPPPHWLNDILLTGELRSLQLQQFRSDSLDDIRLDLIGSCNHRLERLHLLGNSPSGINFGSSLRGLDGLTNLRQLRIRNADADYRQSLPDGLPPNLEDLALVNCNLSDDDMEMLTTCTRLRSLDLARLQCGLGVLAKVGLPSSLKSLNLGDAEGVTKDDLHALKNCTQLEELNLQGAKIDLRDVDGLTLPKSLVKLVIHESKLDASSFRMLSALFKLETLEVNESSFADEDLVGIALSANLKTVGARGTNAGPHFAKALSAAESLESLNLHGNQTNDEALQALGSKPELTLLLMSNSQITDASAEWFLPLTKLQRLELIESAVTDQFFEVAPHLKNVADLRIYGTQVSLPLREEIRDLDLARHQKQQEQMNKVFGTKNNLLPRRPRRSLPKVKVAK